MVGFAADGEALKERLDAIVKMYRYQHGKPMSVKACAQRLSTILYGKRFFPYYVHAILGGLDEEGEIRGPWRHSGVQGLWYMMGNLALCRFHSNHVALRMVF